MGRTRQIPADLGRGYTRALSDFLRSGGEGPLEMAYELGRKGLTDGHGVLDMVNQHHAALNSIVAADCISDMLPGAITKAGEFLAESMSPFEMTHRAVGEANTALRKLNESLEQEVRRIALAMHDDAGQLMVAAQMKLDETARELPASAQAKLRDVKSLLNLVDERIRHLSHELYPAFLEHLGLVPAIEYLASSFTERTGLRIKVESTLNGRLPSRLATPFYRIVQEALTNIRRHANASTVNIRFHNQGGAVHCTVADDGVGFDPKEVMHSGVPSLGLLGIEARLNSLGGKLRIRSAEGRGTKLEITVPMQEVEYADTRTDRG